MLTQERLRQALDYNPETGEFRWKVRPANSIHIGDLAGSVDDEGYRIITLDRKKHAASRLAFMWMLGRWPYEDCDHEDGFPSNDRWANLRDATTTQNMQNKRVQSNNKSGLKGVTTHAPRIWRARIKVNGVVIDLGIYNCPVAAHLNYAIAADKYFGSFARST